MSDDLTKAETEVLKLIACGLSYSQIAAIRGTTYNTVLYQRRMILQKLFIDSSLQAALYAWRNGIIGIDEAWQTLQAVSK